MGGTGRTVWYMLTAGKWEGAPGLDLCPHNLLTVLGQAGKQGGAELHPWLLPAETADLPSAICPCSLLLLFASFLLWTGTSKEKGGRDTALTPLTVTFSSRARVFPISKAPSQPLLRPWWLSLIGHVVYQKTHFHVWETGKQGSVKTGKGSWNIYTFDRCENVWNFKPETPRHNFSFWVN